MKKDIFFQGVQILQGLQTGGSPPGAFFFNGTLFRAVWILQGLRAGGSPSGAKTC